MLPVKSWLQNLDNLFPEFKKAVISAPEGSPAALTALSQFAAREPATRERIAAALSMKRRGAILRECLEV